MRGKGIKLNQAQTGVSIREQFPPEIEERRKPLYREMRKWKGKGYKFNLVRDKLYCDGQVYNPDTDTYENTANKRAFVPTERTDVNRRENHIRWNNDRGNSMSGSQSHQTQLNFTTPNRYDSLIGSNVDDTRNLQRPAYKQKARSPLDYDVNTKKSRDIGNFISHADKQSEQDNVWQERNNTTDYAPMDEYPELPRSTPPGPNNHNNSHVPSKEQVNSQTSPRT